MVKPMVKEILRKAIMHPAFAKEILPIIPKSALDNDNMSIELAQVLRLFYQTNSASITEAALTTLVEAKLDRQKADAEKQQEYFDTISELYDIRDSSDDEVIDEALSKHIKRYMRIELLKKAAMKLDDEVFQDKLADELRYILSLDITGGNDKIINVIDDKEYKRRLLETVQSNTIPTGFKELDRLNGGGLAKGELGLVSALSGSGKTLFLTNLATSYVKQGYNVLFIALEELENRMVLRFEQAMLSQSRADIITNGVLNEDAFERRQRFYEKYRDNFGNLFFARYSPRTVTPFTIEQLISDVLLRKGVQLDIVIIDYPELLRNPNATGNEAEDGGRLFEEVRRIAQDYNVLMWTASQLNRSAYNAVTRTSEHMEGSIRKKNATELVLVVNQTPEEYEAGFVRLYADKVRNPPDGVYDKMLGFVVDGKRQLIRDYEPDPYDPNKLSPEKLEHQRILKEVEDQRNSLGINKGGGDKGNKPPMPNLSDEINKALAGGTK
ncbi:DNA helicase [Bacillus phage vB_BthM-Goe5]|nr:DNA helicase [Bacillus phage vB_BthM-Goe5]